MFQSREVQFAIETVRRAARLVQQVQREMVAPALTKQDRSPVTVGDFAAQALVARLLDKTFPGEPLVAEETATALRDADGRATLDQVVHFLAGSLDGFSPEEICDWIDRGTGEPAERFWTLDPIDGTKGFLRGQQYAVALALIEQGVVQLGVLGCPSLDLLAAPQAAGLGSLYVAVRGGGAWATTLDGPGDDFAPIRVSDLSDTAQARLLRSVEESHTDGNKIGELTALLHVQAEPVRMDSQAKYAVLAGGGGDAMVRLLSAKRPDYREKIWDHAAGALLVEEAGGSVSDLSGGPLDFSRGRTLAENRGLLVTNRRLHAALLDALARIGA